MRNVNNINTVDLKVFLEQVILPYGAVPFGALLSYENLYHADWSEVSGEALCVIEMIQNMMICLSL